MTLDFTFFLTVTVTAGHDGGNESSALIEVAVVVLIAGKFGDLNSSALGSELPFISSVASIRSDFVVRRSGELDSSALISELPIALDRFSIGRSLIILADIRLLVDGLDARSKPG